MGDLEGLSQAGVIVAAELKHSRNKNLLKVRKNKFSIEGVAAYA